MSYDIPLSVQGQPAAHHRHQTSLEQTLNFSLISLTASERVDAEIIFDQLMEHCEPLQRKNHYKTVTLVRLTYEHCQSKDTFLKQFFIFIDNDISNQNRPPPTFEHGLSHFHGFNGQTASPSLKKKVEGVVDSFAEYLFQNFFLPLKAAGSKTPQPTPAALSAPSLGNVVGAPARLSTLRRDCLIRDHNRCVVTQAFNLHEAKTRDRLHANPKDDDDQPLSFGRGDVDELEVAHIIPHSILSAKFIDGELQLSESKKTALSVLSMFDPGVIPLIEGSGIDHPTNAITLSKSVHTQFGLFEISFEAMDSSNHPQNTYTIHSSSRVLSQLYNLPVTRTLLLSPNLTIDPPSAKLLAIHRAIAIIIALSAAGEYMDQILRDMEEVWVRSDGAAEMGRIVSLKIGGWLDSVVA
ncbi:uncharacterized protein BDCG_16117 [Blastomyces dermatitidis ER-3]|uniref:HNH nuclease domain-containing protein n=2 Tax=Ajellomyces dermatitidis TaxID=5039 RepID=F2TTW0_AJEDA|nr:uncharacterized protein BDCG_16117 [Blastomyces dermatitidis ER-3]EGE86673.1 hypothetical protein BDDG_09621 [Blastomyces dermatitidis ATCC 18188]OAS99417.1 hypothetical protein BDCG_16117 [Blastomyces dermatitidis ER-3]